MGSEILIGPDGTPIECWAPRPNVWLAKGDAFPTPAAVEAHLWESEGWVHRPEGWVHRPDRPRPAGVRSVGT